MEYETPKLKRKPNSHVTLTAFLDVPRDNGREVGRQMQMFSQRQSLPSYSSLLEKHDLKKTRNTTRPFCHEHVEIEVSDHERGSDQTAQHIGQRQASDEKVQS